MSDITKYNHAFAYFNFISLKKLYDKYKWIMDKKIPSLITPPTVFNTKQLIKKIQIFFSSSFKSKQKENSKKRII